jgi:23S rRNA (guanosine2251-2'-O)-methyltransferase
MGRNGYISTIILEGTQVRKLTHEEISLKRLKADEARIATRLPIYGLLDNIRSLYNVGSMFRSSDGAMVEKLYLCGHTPHPPRKEIDKTALGATGTVPWEYAVNPLEAVTALRSAGIRICVLEQTTNSLPYYDIRKADFPICLVVGNEIAGVSPELVAAADMAIEIPMCGSKQSLNVAVAFGVALYDLVRVYKS